MANAWRMRKEGVSSARGRGTHGNEEAKREEWKRKLEGSKNVWRGELASCGSLQAAPEL